MDELYIGLINDSFPPQIDGVANAVKNYAEVITRHYGRALVAAPYYPDADDSAYPYRIVRYKSVDVSEKVGYRAGNPLDPRAIDAISKEPLQLLHAHCPVTAVMLGRSLRETMNIPMVFTYHTKFDIDIRNAISKKLLQEAAIKALVHNIESCDDVWVVSRGAGENLRSLGYSGDYTVMENGVDMPKGRADEAAIRRVSAEYNLDPEIPTFLFVGRLMWYKGIRLILSALHLLKAEGVRFRMLFVGQGGDEEEIKAYTRDLNLAEECTFVGAVHDRETLRAIYSACDLFLFPSTFDTNGLVVREAAAAGLVSVLIEGSSAAEGVTDGETGILSAENTEAYAKAIRAVCGSKAAMRVLGERAMDGLYCSWETSVGRAVERYRDVIRASKAMPKRPMFADDPFYRSVGDLYQRLQSVRELYAKARERRESWKEDAEEWRHLLREEAQERKETIRERIVSHLKPQESPESQNPDVKTDPDRDGN